MASMTPKVYQFKITLKDIKPPIWRRIQVPEDYSFYDLHMAITDAMGWKDYHCHKFEVKIPNTRQTIEIGEPFKDASEYGVMESLDDKTTKISSYFLYPKDCVNYEYDFGDGWEHKIMLENMLPAKSNTNYPLCLTGKRACPPEDCGGTEGYEDFLTIISNPNHSQYREMMDWSGGDFNPEKFDSQAIVFRNSRKL